MESMKSFKIEVLCAGETNWASNGLRFAVKEEAIAYAEDLFSRWFAVREKRITPCEDAPTHTFWNGKLEKIK